VAESEAPGDGRSIENPDADPTDPTDMPEELEEAVRSDAGQQPVRGEHPDGAGEEGERVSEPGDGLVTEEGVNEPGTDADAEAAD
jgi:hypothetical protein